MTKRDFVLWVICWETKYCFLTIFFYQGAHDNCHQPCAKFTSQAIRDINSNDLFENMRYNSKKERKDIFVIFGN